MSDLLQVSDLEKTKFHNTFHVEAVTGKAGGLAGGADIDFTTNAVTGQVQKTLPKILADIDWSYVGLFADGVTFTKRSDFAVDAVGIQWVYVGAYPFTAIAGTVPSSPTYQVVHTASAEFISKDGGGSVQDFIDATINNISNINKSSMTDMLQIPSINIGSIVNISSYNENVKGGDSTFAVVDSSEDEGILSDNGLYKFKRLSGHDYFKQILLSQPKPAISAHRGWHGVSPNEYSGTLSAPVYFVPENTIQSIRFCSDLGANFCESDTKLTLDGELVVFHDDTVNRTASGQTGNIGNFTLAQLKTFDVGTYVSNRYADCRIMTVLEWLYECRKSKIRPHCEISIGATDAQIASYINAVEYVYGIDCRDVLITSTNMLILQKMREINSYIALALLPSYGSTPSQGQINQVYQLGNSGLVITGAQVTANPNLAKEINSIGMFSIYAIANTPAKVYAAAANGFDMIVTDFIGVM